MNTYWVWVVVVLAAVLCLAAAARLRLWYYERRWAQQVGKEMATEARCRALRDQCSRIWWEGQR